LPLSHFAAYNSSSEYLLAEETKQQLLQVPTRRGNNTTAPPSTYSQRKHTLTLNTIIAFATTPCVNAYAAYCIWSALLVDVLATMELSTVRPSHTTRPSRCMEHLFKGIHSEPVISLNHTESVGFLTSDSKPPSPPASCFNHTCRVKSMISITSIASYAHTSMIHCPLDEMIGETNHHSSTRDTRS